MNCLSLTATKAQHAPAAGSDIAAQHSLRLEADQTASMNIQSSMPGKKL